MQKTRVGDFRLGSKTHQNKDHDGEGVVGGVTGERPPGQDHHL